MGFTLGVAGKVRRLLFSRPTKEKSAEECDMVKPGLGSGAVDFESKDETFFDTRVWLDSDCEDDYYSVNGDFTPSRGSTPNRQFGTIGAIATPPPNGKASYADMSPDNRSQSSPTDKKKLAELLRVSLSEPEGNGLDSKAAIPDDGLSAKLDADESEMSRPQSSSEGTPKPKKERSGLAASCCMPGLMPGISSRKQKLSPAR